MGRCLSDWPCIYIAIESANKLQPNEKPHTVKDQEEMQGDFNRIVRTRWEGILELIEVSLGPTFQRPSQVRFSPEEPMVAHDKYWVLRAFTFRYKYFTSIQVIINTPV